MKTIKATFMLSLFLIVVVNAEDNWASTNTATLTANKWLSALDDNRQDIMKELISKEMKKVLPQEEIVRVLFDRRAEKGKLVNRRLLKTEHHRAIYNFPAGEYQAFTFISNYSEKRQVKHLVRVIKESEKWFVISDLELDSGE